MSGSGKPSTAVDSPAAALTALTTPEGRANPYPHYESLRAHGPVLTLGNRALIVGYDECAQALREPAFVSPDGAVRDRLMPGWRSQPAWQSICTTMLFKNDPDHERLRRFSGSAFGPAKVAALEPTVARLAEEAADRLAAGATAEGRADFMAAAGNWLPLAVMSAVLGIPRADFDRVQPLLRPVTEGLDPFGDSSSLAEANDAVHQLGGYFQELIAQRRAEPRDDLVTTLTRSHDGGADLSEDELVATFMVLLVAGTAAPFDMLGNVVAALARLPRYAERIRQEPAYAGQFVDEVFRHDPAVHVLNRVADRDVDFCGVPVPKDTAVLMFVAGCNRDPRRYAQPDVFDPDRPRTQPMTFGVGAHFCLGSTLARLVCTRAAVTFAQRFTQLQVAAAPVYRNQLLQRGFQVLPLSVAGAADAAPGTSTAREN